MVNPVLFLIGAIVVIASLFFFKRDLDFCRKFSVQTSRKKYTPFASIIIPCKGVEENMKETMESILSQDYPKYEIIFVLDSKKDPAYTLLKKIAKNKKNTKIILSKIRKTCSGKISALVSGINASKGDVFAFLDADSKPKNDWLRNLVSPLADSKTGITTGYRFYVPNKNFSSYIRCVWSNIGLAQMFGGYKFVWGGSAAIRKETFEELKIREKWLKAVSDDSILTKVIRNSTYEITFVPSCMLTSYGNTTFRDVSEFVTRQTKIVKAYFSERWKTFAALFFVTKIITILGITLLLLSIAGHDLWIEAAMILFTIPINFLKYNIRFSNYKNIISENIGSRTKFVLASFISSWMTVYGVLHAASNSEIVWKGRKYVIRSVYDVEIY